MPYIRRIGLTAGFARFKNGQIIEDVEFLVHYSELINKQLNNANSKEAGLVKKLFLDLSKSSKNLQDNLNQIGAMIYPGVADRYKVQFRGERIANMADYGKDIFPVFKDVLKYCKKNKAQADSLGLRTTDIKDFAKVLSERIENIDLAMRIISNKLS